jgi:hypothetical protein
MGKKAVVWKETPDEHDYDAARTYLSLIMKPSDARLIAKRLQRLGDDHQITSFKAKDILRASQERLLPRDDPHVLENLGKIHSGEKLSPILLVRGEGTSSQYPCIIADGYHRACSIYWYDYDSEIPCVIS